MRSGLSEPAGSWDNLAGMSTPALDKARVLVSTGKASQAEPLLRRHLQREPGNVLANHLLSFALMQLGRCEQAVFFAEKAAAGRPQDAAMWDVLGTILIQLGQAERARDAFLKAVAIDDRSAGIWNGLASVLTQLNEFESALAAYEKAHAFAPDNIPFVCNYAYALGEASRPEEAIELLRTTAAKFPNAAEIRIQLSSILNYSDRVTREEVFDHHVALGRLVEAGVPAPPAPVARSRADRPLRIGLLSGDFRDHSCARFVEPLLRGRVRGSAAFYLYHAADKSDAVTERLKLLADEWRDVSKQDDASAAARIRRDEVDVLVELGAHTAGNRLNVMLHQPAPVLATYLGYPNTTGFRRIHARLVDSRTDPPGPPWNADRFATEHLERLDPCFLCYQPDPDSPDVAPAPCESARHVTFGSFNKLTKASDTTLDLWAKVLAAVPDSRLVLKGAAIKVPHSRERLLAALMARGVAEARLDLLPSAPTSREHLAQYARIDVALDTYPYHGTTTTCEALWMGVPVVTLAGLPHAARVGVSLLECVGMGELVAASPEQYVQTAATLASDLHTLGSLRRTMRERVRSSPLCDAPAFARRFVEVLSRLHAQALSAPTRA